MHGHEPVSVVPQLPVGETYPIAPVEKGKLRARLAQTPDDLARALDLRGDRFRKGEPDGDMLDEVCQHVLIEPLSGGPPVGTFRFLHLADGTNIGLTYAAQFYDLDRLARYTRPLLEIGRFCVGGAGSDHDVLRIGWALLTRYVDAHRIGMMFGCSSFCGTDVSRFRDALALLKTRYLAPADRAPGVKAPHVARYARDLAETRPDLRQANQQMPTLLRTYLAMGGWVSDHAVIDNDLDTFHVFTGVEIDAIPEVRKRLLRKAAV